MRAALYARYSTDQQREQSIEDQLRQCERTASANSLQVVARFSDAGISGGTSARPGYQALLELARRRDISIIVVEDISRLWRNRATYGQDSAELEDAGVHILTCVGDDTRRDGYGLILGIRSALAEYQRREISYRTRRGLEGIALAGKSTGGRCYGYGSPAEADTVRRLFRERGAGVGYRVLAARLNRDGIAAPRGAEWSASTVMRLLANPRYAGWRIWGATESKGGARDSRRKSHVMRSEPLVRQFDASLQLVDSVLWEQCNMAKA